ncbi:MAG: hypothetical protein AMXMBFR66_35960 [Pseudomonadota bacterium]|nr:NAD(P)H-binding protein [Rubrivivax sp.]
MTALLAGASGLVGRELVRQWQGNGRLHLLVRRPLHDKAPGHSVHVVDFAALPPLPRADEAYCALGTTIKAAGSQAAFRAVDHDAVLAFARAALAAGVRRFGVVSALGAQARSANFYSRVKGETEDALAALGFASLVIARPSLLVGDRAAIGQPLRRGEVLAQAITRPLGGLVPKAWRPIAAERVARALLRAVAEASPGLRVLSSGQMQELGAP